MSSDASVRYFGWSAVSVATPGHTLFFDPFYRRYCGAQWFSEEDFANADYIAVTHGHEEHFIDVPLLARRTGAIVIGSTPVTRFLRWRRRLPAEQVVTIDPPRSVEVPAFKIDTFAWKHRDVNLVKALSKAVFHGNTTQLAWAWNSATRAPFYAPYRGYVLTLPSGMTVMNYNEGFNNKMTDSDIGALAQRFKVDVLLAGMQLNFVDDVRRGVATLQPKMVLLYPPHEKFHAMMGAVSRPWSEFIAAAQSGAPHAKVVGLAPGTQVDLDDGRISHFQPRIAWPARDTQRPDTVHGSAGST